MTSPPRDPARRVAGALATRLALFAGVWWALADGSVTNLPLAGAVLLGAAAASLRVTRPSAWRLVPAGLLGFALFFLGRSMLAGLDVARRALDPRLPIAPAVLSYHTTLPAGAPRACFAAVVSLLPGTLTVGMSASLLEVHALDVREDVNANLATLEARIAAIFTPRSPASARLAEE